MSDTFIDLSTAIDLIKSGKKIKASSEFILFRSPHSPSKLQYMPYEHFLMECMLRRKESRDKIYKCFSWRYSTKRYMRIKILRAKMMLDHKTEDELSKIWNNFSSKYKIEFI